MDARLSGAGNDEPYLLLVDDDEVFATTMSRAIGRRGYPVRVAGDISSALAIAEARAPEYAVVDLRLPGGSGLRLVKRLKEIAQDIRIVLLTGFGSIATTIDAIKLGATYYLTKPANADEVIAALHRDDASEETNQPLTPCSIRRLEWEHINRVLDETSGNISASARILGMHRRTLQRKLGKHPAPR